MSESLAEALPREQARVRELMAEYRSIGPGGTMAAMMMEEDLRTADIASASGDVAGMIAAYVKLKAWE